MVTQDILQGNWEEIKGKLRKKWGQLTDNDLAQQVGNVEQLTGLIQARPARGGKRSRTTSASLATMRR